MSFSALEAYGVTQEELDKAVQAFAWAEGKDLAEVSAMDIIRTGPGVTGWLNSYEWARSQAVKQGVIQDDLIDRIRAGCADAPAWTPAGHNCRAHIRLRRCAPHHHSIVH